FVITYQGMPKLLWLCCPVSPDICCSPPLLYILRNSCPEGVVSTITDRPSTSRIVMATNIPRWYPFI
ncbi:MAG: hypothetical protein ACREBU_07940, partial [Nitrososphaera sp.]